MVRVKILVQFYFFGSKMLKFQNMINNKRAKASPKKKKKEKKEKEKEKEKEKKKSKLNYVKSFTTLIIYDL